MNYKETLSYLFSRLPMYQRDGAAAYKADLNNTLRIMELLDHPESKFKSIHIAGTNGKGSVSNIVASILMEAGYKTGLYTSPHMKDFRERILINGVMVPESKVVQFVESNQQIFDDIQPSFFEWTVALAFEYFAKENVDISVIETGLGGRLDSTNVITPLVSVITNVSMDHMNLLGGSITEIAKEKAGIIKAGIPVVVGIHQNDVDKVVLHKANDNNCSVTFAADQYSASSNSTNSDISWNIDVYNKDKPFLKALEIGLTGNFQLENVCTSLAVIDELINSGFKISEENIVEGLKNTRKNFGLKGRWQVIGIEPLIVADNAHNESALNLVVDQLELTSNNQLHIILGMSNDKEYRKMLQLFPSGAQYYFCKSATPRSLDETILKKTASELDLIGESYATVSEAVKAALNKASKNDLIFIGGSTFVVADALILLDN